MSCTCSPDLLTRPAAPREFNRLRIRGPFWLELIVLLILSLGVARAAHAGVFEPQPLSDEAYGESFTAIADLNDGTYVLLQYVFTNAGFGDGKAACRGLVVGAGKSGQNSAARFDRDEWSYTAQGNRLAVGSCELSSQGGKTRFKVKTKELSIDLTLGASPRRVRPPKHRVKVDSDAFYESEVLIPWAEASAVVNSKSASGTLKGMGYLDHTRSNTRLPKIASRWLRFRGFKGTKRLLLEIRYDPKGRATGWQWLEGTPKPAALSLTGLKLNAKRDAVSLNSAVGTLTTSSVIYRYRPAKEWGMLGRLAKPWVGDPETRTFRASLTLSDGQTIQGILEQAQIAN